MKVAIGSDHRGHQAKEAIKRFLTQMGHDVSDFGTHEDQSTDYPDIAVPVCAVVSRNEVDRGILLCGSGIGMCMTANKVRGIRAALCHDELTAEMSRRHNDANVLCMAGDLLGDELMRRMVEIWMATEFEGGRHERRIQKMMKVEEGLDAFEVKEKPTETHPKGHRKKG
ncbi:MAG: ribose 5-phosphate isomerase B [Planctomycetes bacterium]|nr:ribose 5-phosphate isomerase B [Planctomycetota bacterium]